MSHLYDSWDAAYKTPFGAVRKGKLCRFNLRLPKDVHPDYPPVLVLFRTGFKERFLNLHFACEEDDCNVWENGHGTLAALTLTSFHLWQNLCLQRLDCLFI